MAGSNSFSHSNGTSFDVFDGLQKTYCFLALHNLTACPDFFLFLSCHSLHWLSSSRSLHGQNFCCSSSPRCWKGESRRNKMGTWEFRWLLLENFTRNSLWFLHGQSWVTWPPLGAKEAGECGVSAGHFAAPNNIGVLLVWKKGKWVFAK